MPRPRDTGKRGQKTRERILQVATALFAENGYAATRLEDIAEEIGVKRAALAYYFRNKQELYDAVLNQAAGNLVDRAEAVLTSASPPLARIEAMVEIWLVAVADRPWLSRLLLHQAATATPAREPDFAEHSRRLLRLTNAVLEDGRRAGLFDPVDAVHLVSALAGISAFYVSVIPAIDPRGPFDPADPVELARHREQMFTIVRRLLGVQAPASTAAGEADNESTTGKGSANT